MDTSVYVELEKINKSEQLSQKQMREYLDAFASQVAIIFDAAMKGRAAQELLRPHDRVNGVMTLIEIERCLAHFQVIDAVIKKLGGYRCLEDSARKSIDSADAFLQRVRALK